MGPIDNWTDLGRAVNVVLAAIVVVLMVVKIRALWPHLSVRVRDYWWALFIANVTIVYAGLEILFHWNTELRVFLVTFFVLLTLKGVLGRKNGILAEDVVAIDSADVVRGEAPRDTRLSAYGSGLHSADAGMELMEGGDRRDMYWDPALGQWRMKPLGEVQYEQDKRKQGRG